MKFEKYHGLGNDFLITEDLSIVGNSELIKSVCNRYTGIGSDGLIIVKKDPLEMIFYNQDGTRGEMCGNGIRCFSYYCYNHNLLDSNNFECHTLDGVKHLEIKSDSPFIVKVKMGEMIDKIESINIEFNGKQYLVYSLNFGVPHAVIYTTEEITEELGKYISNHPYFVNKTNVNFVNIIDENNIKIITYERGVGFTKACGTGSCSSVVVSKKLGLVKNEVFVHQALGKLLITIEDNNIYMEGPSKKVGEIIL
jgi:diaminopimelate epimerase